MTAKAHRLNALKKIKHTATQSAMTSKAHRLHALKKIKHTAYVLLLLATSVALFLAVCVVWRICWTVILCPP
jgi:hypothetical protein